MSSPLQKNREVRIRSWKQEVKYLSFCFLILSSNLNSYLLLLKKTGEDLRLLLNHPVYMLQFLSKLEKLVSYAKSSHDHCP